jgi:hypothetical protein
MTVVEKVATRVRTVKLLWIGGTGTLVAWVLAKVVFHKGGFVHVTLVIAVCCYLIQFLQDCRTREYRKSLDR